MNSMSALYNNLSGTTNANGQAFRGQSQTNVHSLVRMMLRTMMIGMIHPDMIVVIQVLILILVPTNL